MSWTVTKVTDTYVYIVDHGDGKSVTNSAERVCELLYASFRDRDFVYRDTMGELGMLLHIKGQFIGYKNLPENYMS